MNSSINYCKNVKFVKMYHETFLQEQMVYCHSQWMHWSLRV